MKNTIYEFRYATLMICLFVLALSFGGCSDFPELPDISKSELTDKSELADKSVLTEFKSHTGTFQMDDNCVDGNYVMTISDAPDENNILLITNFHNSGAPVFQTTKYYKLRASAEGSGFAINHEPYPISGQINVINGFGKKVGQKLELTYSLDLAFSPRNNYDAGTKHCKATGFEL